MGAWLYGAKELVVMAYSANGTSGRAMIQQMRLCDASIWRNIDGTSFDTDHIGWFKVIENSPTDWQAFYSAEWNYLPGIERDRLRNIDRWHKLDT